MNTKYLVTVLLMTLVAVSCSDKDQAVTGASERGTFGGNSQETSFNKTIESDLADVLNQPLKKSDLKLEDLADQSLWTSYGRPRGVEVAYTPYWVRLSKDDQFAMELLLKKTEDKGFFYCSMNLVTQMKLKQNEDQTESMSLDLENASFIFDFGVDHAGEKVSEEKCFGGMTWTQVKDVFDTAQSKQGINIFKIEQRNDDQISFSDHSGSEVYKFVRE